MSRILVVDDGRTMVKIIAGNLEKEGHDVIAAYDGQEGLIAARREKPDLIILDLNLPKINGYMVCRMLKYDEATRHIPIIMFTSLKSDADKWTGIEVGADAYLTKPVKPEELAEKVREMLAPPRSR
jgi:two-component system alkaline phosphatase synthesis response regulator PhoP